MRTYLLFTYAFLYLFSCTSSESNFTPLFRISDGISKNIKAKFDEDKKLQEFKINDSGYLFFRNKQIFESSFFNMDCSILIDYFESGNNSFLVITPINKKTYNGSSDPLTLDRKKIMIMDISNYKTYIVNFDEPKKLLSSYYFENLPSGLTIKTISITDMQLVLLSKVDNSTEKIRIYGLNDLKKEFKSWSKI